MPVPRLDEHWRDWRLEFGTAPAGVQIIKETEMAVRKATRDGAYTMPVGKETGYFLVKKGGTIPDGATFVEAEVPDARPGKTAETPEGAPPVIESPEGGSKPDGVETPEGGLHVVDANDTVTIGTPAAATTDPKDPAVEAKTDKPAKDAKADKPA